MTPPTIQTALVIGATGSQGGSAARALLADGWTVRGLTRSPESASARAMADRGVALVTGDLDDEAALERAMEGVDAVFAVTDWFKAGLAKEIEWGKRLADVAHRLGVAHFVYSSVIGADAGTGVPHFESKGEVEQHVRALGLPATFLRPAIFMEDLTDKKYVPPANWGMMPRIVGRDTPIPWVALDDIGAAAARVMADPARWVGAVVPVIGDVCTITEARALFREVTGRRPLALPMPTWLFRRMVSEELVLMWQWLGRSGARWEGAEPNSRTMRTWLQAQA